MVHAFTSISAESLAVLGKIGHVCLRWMELPSQFDGLGHLLGLLSQNVRELELHLHFTKHLRNKCEELEWSDSMLRLLAIPAATHALITVWIFSPDYAYRLHETALPFFLPACDSLNHFSDVKIVVSSKSTLLGRVYPATFGFHQSFPGYADAPDFPVSRHDLELVRWIGEYVNRYLPSLRNRLGSPIMTSMR